LFVCLPDFLLALLILFARLSSCSNAEAPFFVCHCSLRDAHPEIVIVLSSLAVTMSVAKLLSRIVAPSDLDFDNKATKHEALHDHTYGKRSGKD
jgi:hypothetical protein